MIEISGKIKCDLKNAIDKALKKFLKNHHIPPSMIIELSFINPAKMRQINSKYRGIDSSTNVLSFPQDIYPVKKIILGTIFINNDEINFGNEHIIKLVNHGLIHLIGFDHESDPKGWNKEESKL